ncbi:unnamed protein product [Schistosoma turkestanicum]|nr:unnamed protein product [Schistosoma turkestanicum]
MGTFQTLQLSSVRLLSSKLNKIITMGIETAPYTVCNTWPDENVELREYDSLPWVCTRKTATSMDKITKKCFFKLFAYIGGHNQRKVKIEMTAPVTVESKPDAESIMQRCFTMGFYVPAQHHSDPPPPTDDDIFIETRPAMKVYCRNYSGFSNDYKVMKNARELGESLDRLGLKYTPDPFYFAGYDSIFKLTNRRNEIWFKAQ